MQHWHLKINLKIQRIFNEISGSKIIKAFILSFNQNGGFFVCLIDTRPLNPRRTNGVVVNDSFCKNSSL